MTNEELAQWIKEKRKAKGWGFRQLSQAANIRLTRLFDFELGSGETHVIRKPATLEELEAVFTALGERPE